MGRFPATVERSPARRPEPAGDGGRGGAIPGRRARGEKGERFSEKEREEKKKREREEEKMKRNLGFVDFYSEPIHH